MAADRRLIDRLALAELDTRLARFPAVALLGPRQAAGAEMDLVLDLPGGQRWAIAIQRSSAPRLSKGFHQARADLEPQRTLVVYAGDARFPLLEGVEAIGAAELAAALRAL